MKQYVSSKGYLEVAKGLKCYKHALSQLSFLTAAESFDYDFVGLEDPSLAEYMHEHQSDLMRYAKTEHCFAAREKAMSRNIADCYTHSQQGIIVFVGSVHFMGIYENLCQLGLGNQVVFSQPYSTTNQDTLIVLDNLNSNIEGFCNCEHEPYSLIRRCAVANDHDMEWEKGNILAKVSQYQLSTHEKIPNTQLTDMLSHYFGAPFSSYFRMGCAVSAWLEIQDQPVEGICNVLRAKAIDFDYLEDSDGARLVIHNINDSSHGDRIYSMCFDPSNRVGKRSYFFADPQDNHGDAEPELLPSVGDGLGSNVNTVPHKTRNGPG